MYLHGDRNKDRIWAIAGVVAVHGLLAYALLSGLAMRVSERANDSLKLVDIVLPLPPPAPPPPPTEASKPKGEPSPPNLKAVPSPVVAPPPRIRVPAPSPIVVAPVASTGSASSAGASEVAGPGTGTGGVGTGLGGGGSGDGGRRAQLIRGRLNDSDYPVNAKRAGIEGAVAVRFTIRPDGKVNGCEILKSSGSAELDGVTCLLIERRFRYRPARDTQGRAISEVTTKLYTWGLNRRY